MVGCGQAVLDLSYTEAAMKIHTEGCLDIFSSKIKDNIGVVGGVGIGIGFLQVTKKISASLIRLSLFS